MSNLSKLKLGKFLATIAALSSIGGILTTANKAEAVPLYPNDFGSSTQTVRLQMERTAPNGLPVTLNITSSYGLKNNGLFNTWTGNPDGESLYNYITNGSAINFQSKNGSYSINVPTLEIRDGTRLNTYASGFSRYQDWNIEKLGGGYGDTYLFHWRTDTNTNLCLDIRGFAPGQSLNNEIPGLSYCDGNNANQRIRVIKQGTVSKQPDPAPRVRPPNSLINNNAMPPGSSIKSDNACFRLDSQSDGNFVLYNLKASRPIWNSGITGRTIKYTAFLNDGNLVTYDPNNNTIWQLGTGGRGATRLTVQDDGNLVMYNAQNQALWASNTVQPCNPITPPSTQRESKKKVDAFVSSWLGQAGIKRLNTNELQGECVTLIVRYLQDYYKAPIDPPGGLSTTSWGHGKTTAYNVGNIYLKDKFFPVSDPNPPIPGSIISFPNHPYSPTYGHVALVIDSQKNGNNLTLTILESNTDKQPTPQSKVTKKQIVLDISNPNNVSASGHGNGIYWVNPRD